MIAFPSADAHPDDRGGQSIALDLNQRDLRIVVAATIAINLIVLAIPLYINRIYTSVVPEQAGDSLAGITVLLAAVLVLDVLLKALRAWVLTWYGASREHRLRMEAVRALLGSSVTAVRAQPLKLRLTQLRSPTVLRHQLEQQWLVRHVDVPFAVVYLLVLGLIGGWLILPPLLLTPVFMVMARRAARDAVKGYRMHHLQEVQRNQLVVNGLALASTVKTLNLDGFLIRRLEPLQERLSRSGFEQESATAKLQNLSALFAQFNQLLIVSLGGWLVIQQDLSTGALAACTLLSGQVASPLGKLFAADGQRASLEQAAVDHRALLELPAEPNLLIGIDRRPSQTTLTLPGVALHPGEILICAGGEPGQSSRFVHALHALEEPLASRCRFGDQPLTVFRKTWLRRQIARLKTEPQPFRATLLESLTGFEVHRRSDQAISLCERHGVAPMIQALPKGFQTVVGEQQEYPLPAGLRFRLGVMQALLDDPAVLLLDGTYPEISAEALKWFLSLDLQCARLITVNHLPSGLPPSVRKVSWSGDQMVEVAS